MVILSTAFSGHSNQTNKLNNKANDMYKTLDKTKTLTKQFVRTAIIVDNTGSSVGKFLIRYTESTLGMNSMAGLLLSVAYFPDGYDLSDKRMIRSKHTDNIKPLISRLNDDEITVFGYSNWPMDGDDVDYKDICRLVYKNEVYFVHWV